jgi:hypothetical protein
MGDSKVADNGWVGRQRVPIVKASTLEDRTRPATEGSGLVIARLRYSAWMAGWGLMARPATSERSVGRLPPIHRPTQPYR